MAKYLLAPAVNRPLGAIGGSVFQKQGGVFVIRNHNRPIDKKSIRQYIQRNRFESIQQRFRNLSVSDQQTWRDQAPNYVRTDSLGNPYNISGANLQQSSNTFAFIGESPFIDAIPDPVIIPGFTFDTIAFAEPADIFEIVINPPVVPSGFKLLLYATRPLSPGQLTSETPYVFLGIVDEGQNTIGINWFDAYITLFGTVNDKIGSQIFVIAHFLPLTTFQRGVSVYGSGFVES